MQYKWHGRWINAGNCQHRGHETTGHAPYLRKTFDIPHFQSAVIRLCGLGWHELYVNGQKADDRVLAPAVSQYDKHVSYIDYDVSSLLHKGKNAVVVLLGNGFYNAHTQTDWRFSEAPWRDVPKLCCDIFADGKVVAASDRTWKACRSSIIFDAVRNGERQDARLEIPGFSDVDFDDSKWETVELCDPPAGVCIPEQEEPCRITNRLEPVKKVLDLPELCVYDFGMNISGWCEISVEGNAGELVELKYAELLRPTGEITTTGIDHSVLQDGFQADLFILKGGGVETFHPHFTYHGFRYVRVWKGRVKIHSIKACFIHNDFISTGVFSCDCDTLNRLQDMTRRSYLGNFVGIPTDCPQREKNGWTADAALACRTGLWNFDSQNGYRHFLRVLADTQRPSGQLCAIAPSSGWGYSWGSGPAWDNMLFEGIEQLYLFHGDVECIRQYYDNMRLYLDYCYSREEDGILDFGLGDWAHWDPGMKEPVALTSTCYYYGNTLRMARFAQIIGKNEEAEAYLTEAERIAKAFHRNFKNADGTFGRGTMTAYGAVLYFGLAGEEKEKVVKQLVSAVRAKKHHTEFGILGAQYIPRMLAEYGYADDACKLFLQDELPGWGYWVKMGATTLWENWAGFSSHNHIMFGDISAWFFEYAGGITPCWDAPGFTRVCLKPKFLSDIDQCNVQYNSQAGLICSSWKRENGTVKYSWTLPEGTVGELILPNGCTMNISGSGMCIV